MARHQIGRSTRRGTLALLLLAVLAGCASPYSARLIARTAAPARQAQIAATHDIFIATNRAGTQAPGRIFSGERSKATAFARVEISIPAVHEAGMMELAPNPEIADPARYFTARRAALYADEASFESAMRAGLEGAGGRALVFVHGYNTGFDAAVHRAAQIFHDSGYTGLPILFSWPSSGRTIDYLYDSNSATTARDSLEDLLRLVARAGAAHIDIVAHSMGSWVTMEALRQLALVGDRDLGGRISDVILAAPDIDIDVFMSQMRRYGKPRQPFTVIISRKDRALTVSGFIAGNRPRLGDYGDTEALARSGVVVIDVTKTASGDWLHHTTFARNPVLVQLLGRRLHREGDLDEGPDDEMIGRVEALVRGIGQTVGVAADIVVTTPLEVFELTADPR